MTSELPGKKGCNGGTDLQGRGKQETTKQIRDSKTQYFMPRKSNRITRGHLQPEGSATTATTTT